MRTYPSAWVGVVLGAVLALSGCDKLPSPSPTGETGAPPPSQKAPKANEQVALPAQGAALASLAPLADSVRSAVVNVEVRSRARGREEGEPSSENPFGEGFPWPFMEPHQRGQEPLRQGLGSGFIVDPSGLLLTNNHVVEGAVEIQVKLMDGRQFDAEVLGTDPLTDVAVVKLKGKDVKDLPVVRLGDSDAIRVGDWVLAIGNPFGLSSSVSLGILSAKARDIQAGPYDDFLQTDAAINPGNSGGPLFNMSGEVIGINTAIVGGGTGIGFAVPSNLVKALVPELEKEGTVTRGWLGLGTQDLTAAIAEGLGLPVHEGAVVVNVDEGTPAARAGLRPDDVIVALDGKPVASAGALTRRVGVMHPGEQVTLTIYRDGQKQERKVTLGTRPDIEGLSKKESTRPQEEPHHRLGLGLSDVGPRFEARGMPPGALITQVAPGSVAEHSGLIPGMVVVEAAGKPVRSASDLVSVLRDAKPGSVVLLRIQVEDMKALRALRIPE